MRLPTFKVLNLLQPSLIGLVFALGAAQVWAQSVLPTNPTVAGGAANISTPSPSTMQINQQSQRAIVNWDSFSIGQNANVNINQPNVNAALLNRVTGNTTSQIAGNLNANGQVFLVNPNGIAITPTGSVKVGGGFVASTLGISDKDFNAGDLKFYGNGHSAGVYNAGSIVAAPGGFAALLGGKIENSGLIAVPMGKIGVGAGEQQTLNLYGDGFLQVGVPSQSGGNGQPLIALGGEITAESGTIVVRAATVARAIRDVVNISGTVSTASVRDNGGTIIFDGGDAGEVRVTGKVLSTSEAAAGGSIRIGGESVSVLNAALDAGGGGNGGLIMIGGSDHGVDGPGAGMRKADTVSIDEKSTLKADSRLSGHGGKVVIWSETRTAFLGLISARSMGDGGNGGFAEVSSRNRLYYNGISNLLSNKGNTGTLLLDPGTIIICHSGDPGCAGAMSVLAIQGDASTTSTDYLQDTTLATALTLSNVSLSASIQIKDTSQAAVTTGLGGILTLTAPNITLLGNYGVNGGLVLNNTDATSLVSGVISGNGGLTVSGSGKMILTGTNTYRGGTTINSAATLQLGNGGATGSVMNTSRFTVNGTLNFNTTADQTYVASTTSVYTGSGTINKNLTNRVTLGGVELSGTVFGTFTGSINVNAGTLYFDEPGQVMAAAINIVSGAVLTVNADKATETQSAVRASVNGQYGLGFQSKITGGGTLRKVGSGFYPITGSSSNSTLSLGTGSLLDIQGGTLMMYYVGGLAPANSGDNRSNLNIATGATLDLWDVPDPTFDALTGGGNIIRSVNAGKLTLGIDNTAGGPAIFSGVISGAISLSKVGSGTQILTGANTYSGTTSVTAGTLQIGNNGTTGSILGSSAITVAGGANMNWRLATSTTIANAITGSGNVNIAITGAGNNLTLSSGAKTLTGAGVFTATTEGNLILSSAVSINTATTTVLSALGNFTNNVGSTAVQGNWNIYSNSPDTDMFASLDSGTTAIWGNTLATLPATGLGNKRYIFAKQQNIVVTANDGTKTYGATWTPAGTGYTLSGLNAGVAGAFLQSTSASIFGSNLPAISSVGAPATADAGTYSTVPSTGGPILDGSTATYRNGTLTVNPAPLTVQGNNQALTYNGANQTRNNGVVVTGLKNSDAVSGAQGLGSGMDVGTYTDTLSNAVFSSGKASNYTITYVNGTLTINRAALTITGNNQTLTYNGANQTRTNGYTQTGLQGTDAISAVQGYGTGKDVGPYADNLSNATFSSGKASNYTITYINGTLTISRAALTITGGNQIVSFNGNSQINTYTTTGLQGTDAISGVQGRGMGTDVGTYTDTLSNPTFSSGSAANYTITYVNNKLTINPAVLTIRGNNQTALYNGNNQTNTYTPIGLQGSDALSNVQGSGTGKDAGTYADNLSNATFSTGKASNYTIVYQNGALTINPAPLTIQGNNQIVTYNGNTQTRNTGYTSLGLQGSDAVSGVQGLAAGQNVGNYTDSLSNAVFSSGKASNYTITYQNGALTINPASLTIQGANQTVTFNNRNQTRNNGYTPIGLLGTDAISSVQGYGSGTDAGTYADSLSNATFASGRASNYTITYLNGVLTINPAALTIQGGSQSLIYNANDQINTYSTSGLQGTDTISGIQGLGTGKDTGNYADNLSNATFSSGKASNYTITYRNGALTINPAPLRITGNNETFTYNGNTHTRNTGYTSTGLLGTDAISGVQGLAAGKDAGTYADSLSNASFSSGRAANYAITYVNGTLTITPAALMITGNNQPVTYNGGNQTNTYTSAGLQGTDTIGNVQGLGTGKDVGTYADNLSNATFSVGKASNYTIRYTNGALTINRAALTISGANQTVTYSGNNQTRNNGYTPTGLQGTDAISGVQGLAIGKDVGSYTDSLSNPVFSSGNASNYTISYVNGTLTINPAALTITGANQTVTYNSSAQTRTNGYTPVGLLGTDAISSVQGYGSGTDAGTYADSLSNATFSSGKASNYTITYLNGVLTINPAALTIQGGNQSLIYNANNQINPYTVSGLQGTDAISGVQGLGTGKDVGSYADNLSNATFSTGKASNYAITYRNGALTITPAALTITGNNQTLTYNGNTQTRNNGYTSNGLLGTDAISGVQGIAAGKDVGAYGDTLSNASFSSGRAGNYTITYVNGTLTINPAALTIQGNNQPVTYNGGNQTNTYTPVGLQGSDAIGSVQGLGTGKDVGTYADSLSNATFSSGRASNYTITYTNGALRINPAALTITGDNQTVRYNGGNQTRSNGYIPTGLQGTDTILDVQGLATGKDVGTYADSLSNATFSSGKASNYTITYVNGALTISRAALMITGNNQTLTYNGGNQTRNNGYTQTGLQGTDALSGVQGYGAGTDAGTYLDNLSNATFSSGNASNYTITYVNGALTINRAALTIQGNNQSLTYNGANQSNTYTPIGLQGTDALSGVQGLGRGTDAGVYADNLSNATFSSGKASNYTITYTNGALTINRAALTITGGNQTYTYDSNNHLNSYTQTGLQGTDALSGVQGLGTGTDAGTYGDSLSNATFSSGKASNYTITYVNGALKINPAALTIRGNNPSVTYNGANQTNTYTPTGLVGNDAIANVQGVGTGKDVGTYADTLSNATFSTGKASNYTITYVNGALTINRAALTITGDNQSVRYNGNNQTRSNGYTSTGLQGTDTILDVQGLATGKNVGTYTDSLSNASFSSGKASNYTITYVNGTLTINRAALTITGGNQTYTYDGNNHLNSYTQTGLQGTDALSGVQGSGTGTDAGTYADNLSNATFSSGTASNYTITYVNGALKINPAALTITGNNPSVTYNGANQTNTYTPTGLVGNDAIANVQGVGTGKDVGTYTDNLSNATFSTGKASNYTITYVNGALTINRAALTITGNNQTLTYNGGNQTRNNGYTQTGLQGTDTLSGVQGYGAGIDAGTYLDNLSNATFSSGKASNYAITYVNGALTINRAALTITGNNQTLTYNGGNQTRNNGYTQTGLQGTDTLAGVQGYGAGTDVGTYADTLSNATFSTGKASNYTITYVNGALTINPAALTIRGNNPNVTYNGANQTNTYTASGLQGTDALSGVQGLGTGKDVGTYADNLSNAAFSSGKASNYTITYTNGALTINRAALTITGNNQTLTYNGGNQTRNNGYRQTGLQGTDALSGVQGYGAGTDAGTYLDNLSNATFSSGNASNYTITYVNGALTINPAALTIQGNNQSLTYNGANQSNTYTPIGLQGTDALSGVQGLGRGTDVGTYADNLSNATFSSGKASNYTITYTNGALTINRAALTITGNNQTLTYNGNTQTRSNGYTQTGLQGTDALSGVQGLGAGKDVGTYSDNLSNASFSSGKASNYTITYVNGALTINPAALTITGNNPSVTYNGANQTNTYTASGLLGSDALSGVQGLGTGKDVGTYADNLSNATFSSGKASNYTITYTNGALTINRAALTITGNNQTLTYNGGNQTRNNGYTQTGLQGTDTLAGVQGYGSGTDAGTYLDNLSNATFSTGNASNYTITYVNGALTINRAALTITGGNQTYTYDGNSHLNSYTPSGLQGTDALSGVQGVGTGTDAGTYADNLSNATFSSGKASNYTITYVNGALKINPAALTITGNNPSVTYNGANQTNTYRSTGLVGNDAIANVQGLGTGKDVGSYADTLSNATFSTGKASNYAITYVNGALTINRAALTITGNNQTLTYNGGNQTRNNGYTQTGLQGTDTLAGVQGYGAGTDVGTYADTLSNATFSTGKASNYTITYVNGALTINPAALTIRGNNPSVTYNGANQTNTYTASGLQGTDALSGVQGLGTGKDVGTYADNLSNAAFSSGKASNYTITYTNGALTINRAALTITGNNQTLTYNGGNQTRNNGYRQTGLQGTDALSGVQGYGAGTDAGTYLDNLSNATFSSGNASNYTITYVNGALTINPAALTIQGNNQSLTYNGANQSNTYTPIGLQGTDALSGVQGLGRGTDVGTYADNLSNATFSSGKASNYTITYTNGALTINRAALTITGGNQTYTYDGNNHLNSYTPSGLQGTDALSGVQGVGTGTDAGTYADNLSNASFSSGKASNYTITYVNGSLKINPAALTIRGNNPSVTYNGANQTNTYTPTGLVGNDAIANVQGVGTGQDVGRYADNLSNATFSSGKASNYTITYVNGALTINPAALTIRGNNPSVTYNGANQTNTYTASGLQGTDALSGVQGLGTGKDVGTYADNLSNAAFSSGKASNYTITYTNGALTINRAALTITGNNQTLTYNGGNQTRNNGYRQTGLQGTDALSGVQGYGAGTDAGTYLDNLSNATFSSGNASNYTITYVNGALTINPAALTIQGNNQSLTYNGANQSNTYTPIGLQGTDALSGVQGLGRGTDVGTYADNLSNATFSSGKASNYTITYTNGALTINRAALTITGGNQTYTYDGNNHLNSYTPSGLQGTDALSGVQGVGTGTDAGTYADNLSNASFSSGKASNYTITYVNGSLKINPAALTIRGNNPSVTYNGANQTNTYTPTGLVGNDAIANVQGVGTGQDVGRYADNLSNATFSSGKASNYTITYVNGALTINPAALTIRGNNPSVTYNGANQTNTYTASGLQGTDALSGVQGLGTGKDVGTYADNLSSAAFSSGKASNYTITYTNGALTINRAALTITGNNQTLTYNGGNQTRNNGYRQTGLQGTDALSGVQGYGAGTDAGTYLDNLSNATFSSGNASNYTITYVNGALTINPAALTIQGNNQSLTYNGANQSNTYTPIGLQGTDALSGVQGLGRGTDVGTYADNLSNATFSSGKASNYTITYTNGALTINRAALTITGNNQTLTYNGNTQTRSNGYTQTGLQGTDALSGVQGLGAGKDVGTYSDNLSNASFSSGKASNYTITYVNGALTINPAALTITGNNPNVTYNGANQTNTYTASGLQGSDALSGVQGLGTGKDVGTYADNLSNATFSSGKASNYTITYTNGALTINRAALTITGNNQTLTYNGGNQTRNNGYTQTGLQGTDTLAGVQGYGAGTDAGTYLDNLSNATFSSGNASNYTITYVNGALTINPAALTIQGNNQSLTYNGANQSNTYTPIGLQGTDALSGVQGLGTGKDVGSYADNLSNATFSSGKASNYTITYTNGALTINRAALTITGNNQTLTYNGNTQTRNNGYTQTGLQGSDALSGVQGYGSGSDAGTYSDNLSNASFSSGKASNYAITYVNGTLTINPAALTITGNNQPVTYNGGTQTNTYTSSGLQGSDTIGNVQGLGTGKDVGTYSDNLSNASFSSGKASNYTITYQNGALTINRAALTITGNNQTVTYNGGNQTRSNGYTPIGLQGTDAISGVQGLGAGMDVGTYADNLSNATFSSGNASNYTITYVNGALTINPAALTITGRNETVAYNGSNQTRSNGYTLAGLQGTDAISGVQGLGAGTDAGTYGDNLSNATFSSGKASNYTITYNNGTLTINPAALTIEGGSSPVTYNGGNQTNTYRILGLQGTDTISGIKGLGTGSDAGSYADNLSDPTFSSGKASNYAITYRNNALTINPADLTIVGNNDPVVYTGNNLTNTYKALGLQGADAISDVLGLGTGQNIGTYADNMSAVLFSSGKASNYRINYQNGALRIVAGVGGSSSSGNPSSRNPLPSDLLFGSFAAVSDVLPNVRAGTSLVGIPGFSLSPSLTLETLQSAGIPSVMVAIPQGVAVKTMLSGQGTMDPLSVNGDVSLSAQTCIAMSWQLWTDPTAQLPNANAPSVCGGNGI